MEHIFEPFLTADGLAPQTAPCLLILYEVAETYDGNMICRPKPGEGTAFEICLRAIEKKQEVREV